MAVRNQILLTLTLLTGAAISAFAADTTTYSGEWSSSSNSSAGQMKVTVDGASKCQFTFTVPDANAVKVEHLSCKLESGVIEAEYRLEAEGFKLKTKLKGKLADNKFEGSYETFTPDDQKFDAGTWKATQQKS